jgi:hypothetical protein
MFQLYTTRTTLHLLLLRMFQQHTALVHLSHLHTNYLQDNYHMTSHLNNYPLRNASDFLSSNHTQILLRRNQRTHYNSSLLRLTTYLPRTYCNLWLLLSPSMFRLYTTRTT